MNLDSLFAAAREDGPTEDRKRAAWDEIASATGAASIAAATKGSAHGMAGAKALLSKIGLLSAIAIGITAGGGAVLGELDTLATGDSTDQRSTNGVTREPPSRPSIRTARVLETVRRTQASGAEDAIVGAPPAATALDEGSLAEETRLLTTARAALVRGDAAGAMALLQETKKLKSRALEPEELGLEARVAKALGLPDEAEAAEMRLKATYPDHALAH